LTVRNYVMVLLSHRFKSRIF